MTFPSVKEREEFRDRKQEEILRNMLIELRSKVFIFSDIVFISRY